MAKLLEFNCAIVTGGGGGIGKEIARYFLSQGKQCILVGRTESNLRETASELGATGYYVLDTGKTDDISGFAKRIVAEHPQADCLVNNAGVQRPLEVLETDDFASKADSEIDINIRGPLHLTLALLPHFETKQHAVVVNVTSILGFLPTSIINPVYNGTKAWLHFWTMNLRSQLKARGSKVSVVEIAPPQVETDLHRERADPDDNKKKNSPSALSLHEFVQEVTQKLENGDECISAGPANDIVQKWYKTYGEDYDKAETAWTERK